MAESVEGGASNVLTDNVSIVEVAQRCEVARFAVSKQSKRLVMAKVPS